MNIQKLMSKTKFFSVFFLFLTLMSFGHVAFAADNSLENSPAIGKITLKDYLQIAPEDKAKSMIEQIFGKINAKTIKEKPQTILGAMFKEFNSTLLILLIAIMIYHFLISTLSTAVSGQFMVAGKKASMWLPLRMVSAIGLVLPTPSGYSIIQIFFLWVIMQGIGVADALWDATVNYLEQDGASSNLIAPVQPYIAEESNLVANVLASSICRERAHNKYRKKFSDEHAPLITNVVDNKWEKKLEESKIYRSIFGGKAHVKYEDQLYDYSYYTERKFKSGSLVHNTIDKYISKLSKKKHWFNIKANCGSFHLMVPKDTESAAYRKYLALKEFFGDSGAFSARGSLAQAAYNYVKAPSACKAEGLDGDALDSCIDQKRKAAFMVNDESIVTYYANQLYNSLQYEAKIYIDNHQDLLAKNVLKDAEKYGWVYAGGYYYSIAKLNNTLHTMVELDSDMVTQTRPRSTLLRNFHKNYYFSKDDEAISEMMVNNNTVPQIGLPFSFGTSKYESHNITHSVIYAVNNWLNGFIPQISAMVTGKTDGADPNLGYFANQSVNPLVKIQALGNRLVYGIIGLFVHLGALIIGAIFIAALVAAIPFVGGIGLGIIQGLGVVFMIFGLPFVLLLLGLLVVGFSMSTYLPLAPFLIFLFVVIGWLFAVLETIVAAPLVALGLADPEGQHQMWGRAEPAVQLILNVFIRPSLVIFGMISSMVVSEVAVNFFTSIYAYVVGDVVSTLNTGANFFQIVLYLIIYVGTVITIVNRSFMLIHLFPDRLLAWISWQKSFGEYKGGEDVVEKGFDSASGRIAGASKDAAEGGIKKGSGTLQSVKPPAPKNDDAGEDAGQGGVG